MVPQLKANLLNNGIQEGDRFLPARAVWERYGITQMTLWRWTSTKHGNDLGFPKPVYFGRFRHWRLSELLEWEMSRPKVGMPFGVARSRASTVDRAA